MGPQGIPSVGARGCLAGKGAPPVSGAWGLTCLTLTRLPREPPGRARCPHLPLPHTDIQVEANLGRSRSRRGGGKLCQLPRVTPMPGRARQPDSGRHLKWPLGGKLPNFFFFNCFNSQGNFVSIFSNISPLDVLGTPARVPPHFKVAGFSSSGETCPDKATPRAGGATNAAQRRALLPLDLQPLPLLPPHLRCCPLDAAGRGASPIPDPTSSGLILN